MMPLRRPESYKVHDGDDILDSSTYSRINSFSWYSLGTEYVVFVGKAVASRMRSQRLRCPLGMNLIG